MVVSRRFFERDRLAAGVEQGEAAGAVGRLHHARLRSRPGRRSPPAGRRRRRRSGSPRRRAPGRSTPKSAAQSRTSGSMASRHAKMSAAGRRPSRPCEMSKSSVREALVASVACTLPPVSRQSRKRVDRAEGELARSARGARARHVVEQPGDLGAGEIGVEQQAGLRLVTSASCPARLSVAQRSAVRRSCQTMARWIGLPVSRVPDERRLALVGDADRRDVGGARCRPCRAPPAVVATTVVPDLLGIVLDPARAGKCCVNSCCADAGDRQVRRRNDGAASRSCPGRSPEARPPWALTPSGKRRTPKRRDNERRPTSGAPMMPSQARKMKALPSSEMNSRSPRVVSRPRMPWRGAPPGE